MRDDLKAAFRSFRSSMPVTIVALIVLTLGIGASTTIFSVVDAVVLRALPFDEHDRLVAVGERRAPGPTADPARDPLQLSSIAPQNYLDWAAEQQVFEAMAAIDSDLFTLRHPSAEPEEIVGVVGDVHQSSLETEPREEVYLPIAQQSTFGAVLVIHTRGNPYTVLPAVKAAVLAVLPDVPLRNVQAMEELMARHVAQRRLTMLLLGLFGLLGLVIAAVGIYGVLGYVVSQRTREIGVRMALGATRGKVVGMVMTKACLLVTAGLLIGTVGAWYLSAAAESFLFRTQANDPRVFLVALMALGLAGLVASAIPARRAASVDPIVALRTE